MNLQDMKQRRSVRTFDGKGLDPEMRAAMREFLADVPNPFGIEVTFDVLDAEEHGLTSKVISGANYYVCAKVARKSRAELAFGYSFEKFMLQAHSLGLGTVCLAGTLDRPAFERAMNVGEGEFMPCVSPLGRPARKRSLREKAMRAAVKADTRHASEKLFFTGDFAHPLSESEAGMWSIPLEAVRCAPSARNAQPWRLVVDGDQVHFFEARSKGFEREATGDVQKIDLGIAACHFDIAAAKAGIAGGFLESDPGIQREGTVEYVYTFKKSA